MGEMLDAVKDAMRNRTEAQPVNGLMWAPNLKEPGPLKRALLTEATEEEKAFAAAQRGLPPRLRKQQKEPTENGQRTTEHVKVRRGLSEYEKGGEPYFIEYRQPEGGKWTLYHADGHLMEQLQPLPIPEHRAAMARMGYAYKGREVL